MFLLPQCFQTWISILFSNIQMSCCLVLDVPLTFCFFLTLTFESLLCILLCAVIMDKRICFINDSFSLWVIGHHGRKNVFSLLAFDAAHPRQHLHSNLVRLLGFAPDYVVLFPAFPPVFFLNCSHPGLGRNWDMFNKHGTLVMFLERFIFYLLISTPGCSRIILHYSCKIFFRRYGNIVYTPTV